MPSAGASQFELIPDIEMTNVTKPRCQLRLSGATQCELHLGPRLPDKVVIQSVPDGGLQAVAKTVTRKKPAKYFDGL